MESTIIIARSKSVLVFVLHSLEYVLGLARFRVFVPKLYYYKKVLNLVQTSVNYSTIIMAIDPVSSSLQPLVRNMIIIDFNYEINKPLTA